MGTATATTAALQKMHAPVALQLSAALRESPDWQPSGQASASVVARTTNRVSRQTASNRRTTGLCLRRVGDRAPVRCSLLSSAFSV